jgi:Secretion system C-terminal sorting domain
MKSLFLFLFCGFASYLSAQNSIGSLNANAISTNSYSHTIGDIYIQPAANAPSNSGMMGVLSGIRSQLVAVENTTAEAAQAYFYPNPVQNILNLGIKQQDNTAIKATVYDITGKMMLSQMIPNGQIDVSELPEGAYIVTLIHAKEELSFKIIKK